MTMDKRPHISAKNKTDLLPNEGVLHAASEGGAGCTSRGSRITVGIASRTAQLETPCVKGGTHPMYPYRPDEAKRLLKELGYDAQNPLRFTILISNQDMTMSDVATLIKNQLAKIGVEAKITLVDEVTRVDRVLVKHDFEMVVTSWATLRDINQRSVSFFKGRQSDYMGIDDPHLEAMVLQWRRTMAPAGRRDISAQ